MKISRTQTIGLATVILMFAVAFFIYPQMPENIASHWNINGQADSYLPKILGLFLLPGISLIMYLLLIFIPQIDPQKRNIEKFRVYYDVFILIFLTFLFYLYAMTIFWSLGIRFNFNQVIVPPFTLLFYYIGVMLEHSEMNWTVGIRTPWTLENKTVWEKTHQLGALLFKISAGIGFLGIIAPLYSFWFILTPIILSTVFVIIYSFFLFNSLTGEKENKKLPKKKK